MAEDGVFETHSLRNAPISSRATGPPAFIFHMVGPLGLEPRTNGL